MTNNPESSMGKAADIHLCIKVLCRRPAPLGLAPTTSTTATLVMGAMRCRRAAEGARFHAEDFALSHPGGALAASCCCELAISCTAATKCAHVSADASLRDALLEITCKIWV